METPFVFGKIASDKNFTDRESETARLVSNFKSLINTILISPRRWGKSSLVTKAAEIAAKKDKSLRFCLVDLYNVRSEEQFYQLLAQEVLRASSSKMSELLGNTKKFMGRFIPKITFSPEPNNEFTLGIDWQEVKKQPDDILNLAENIAKEKKFKFIICIDEFQNISDFGNPLALQKKLRSHWQKHKNVSYCLYGSKRHMLMDVFTSVSMPFYKFGDIIFLQKINEKELVSFIKNRFVETGKKINDDNARLITSYAECHPYYTQQLAQQVWLRTDKICNEEIVNVSHENLVMQLSMLFQTLTDELSNTQINFIYALLKEAVQLSSKKTLHEFNLGTSANILRIKQALTNKEIIDIQGGKIIFLDPIYKYWLKKYYYKILNLNE
ncbi:MAG TPA: ATP-binding protein [Bacteroidales bacterium]|nr:ATP-binding protein [Bacteroidales bacterium]